MNKFNYDNLSMMRVVTLITFGGSVLSLVLLLITFYIFVTFRYDKTSKKFSLVKRLSNCFL